MIVIQIRLSSHQSKHMLTILGMASLLTQQTYRIRTSVNMTQVIYDTQQPFTYWSTFPLRKSDLIGHCHSLNGLRLSATAMSKRMNGTLMSTCLFIQSN